MAALILLAEGAGRGAGATVVRAGAELLLVRQVARALLNHFVQSVVVALLDVVVLTAPGDEPLDVCAPAARQAGLVALPGFVQS